MLCPVCGRHAERLIDSLDNADWLYRLNCQHCGAALRVGMRVWPAALVAFAVGIPAIVGTHELLDAVGWLGLDGWAAFLLGTAAELPAGLLMMYLIWRFGWLTERTGAKPVTPGEPPAPK